VNRFWAEIEGMPWEEVEKIQSRKLRRQLEYLLNHIVMWIERCSHGRTSPRVRCVGRYDDVLIVRGLMFFPVQYKR
jgi:phenylacetate-coenzyme A ligase PaaK-like adenylate-forming protein